MSDMLWSKKPIDIQFFLYFISGYFSYGEAAAFRDKWKTGISMYCLGKKLEYKNQTSRKA